MTVPNILILFYHVICIIPEYIEQDFYIYLIKRALELHNWVKSSARYERP